MPSLRSHQGAVKRLGHVIRTDVDIGPDPVDGNHGLVNSHLSNSLTMQQYSNTAVATTRSAESIREVNEVERLELRLRNDLLLLTTVGQPVEHDGVEVDIGIHNIIGSTFRFRMRIPGA
jgi:hypothetical protein